MDNFDMSPQNMFSDYQLLPLHTPSYEMTLLLPSSLWNLSLKVIKTASAVCAIYNPWQPLMIHFTITNIPQDLPDEPLSGIAQKASQN